jgi:hypothetical protein
MAMVRCPNTKREISTGIQMDRETFLSKPVFFRRTYYPLCCMTHEWFAKDAWVCDFQLISLWCNLRSAMRFRP